MTFVLAAACRREPVSECLNLTGPDRLVNAVGVVVTVETGRPAQKRFEQRGDQKILVAGTESFEREGGLCW